VPYSTEYFCQGIGVGVGIGIIVGVDVGVGIGVEVGVGVEVSVGGGVNVGVAVAVTTSVVGDGLQALRSSTSKMIPTYDRFITPAFGIARQLSARSGPTSAIPQLSHNKPRHLCRRPPSPLVSDGALHVVDVAASRGNLPSPMRST